MLTRYCFPLCRRGLALVALLTLAALLQAAPARADDNLLRGPHPFLKENEVSVHYLLSVGLGDSFGGNKLGLEYGYRLGGPNWLNLQVNLQTDTCAQPCNTGKAFETMAGGKWKFATSIPVVGYGKAGAGLIFIFPADARAAVGLAARVGGGASYFLFDWLGLGIEANLSIGRASYESSYLRDPGYTIFDVGGGVELQF